jgi:transposase-like protein
MPARKGRCPRCLVGGYRLDKPNPYDGRPSFHCDRCGNHWTEGWNGGDSLRALVEMKKEQTDATE